MAFNDEIEQLVEQAVQILATGDNVITDEFTRFNTIYIGNIKPDRVTFELQLTLPEIARVLNYDLERFFQDRLYNFQKTLEYRIWQRQNIPDDSPFIGIYEMDYAVHCLEYSMFGMQPRWTQGQTPSYALPIINTREDLQRLKVPDFFKDGFMPRLIEDYYKIKEDLNDRLEVGIRKSVQGPFQTATGLHGQENVFMEELTEPDLVNDLMQFAFEFHKEWVRGWEKLHGRSYGMFNLGDDDIDTKFTVPPKVYRKLILPVHMQYAQEFKSIHWHSCGNKNNIFSDIATIPYVKTLEIGPKDDARKAAELFAGREVVFYKCPDAMDELDAPVPGAREAMIENVLSAGELVPIKILCEADSLEHGLELLKIFRQISGT
jgi:hypothetical protein